MIHCLWLIREERDRQFKALSDSEGSIFIICPKFYKRVEESTYSILAIHRIGVICVNSTIGIEEFFEKCFAVFLLVLWSDLSICTLLCHSK